MKWNLLLLPPLVPSYPPPLGRHFGVCHFDSGSNTMRKKIVFETTSYPTSLFNRFWTQFPVSFGAKFQKSIPDWYLSQAWFRSRFLLPKSWIQVLSRKVKNDMDKRILHQVTRTKSLSVPKLFPYTVMICPDVGTIGTQRRPRADHTHCVLYSETEKWLG